MKTKDIINLITLSALWGMSFLFTRVAVTDFGSFALTEARVFIAALFLLPIILFKKKHKDMITHFGKIIIIGFLNSALPFFLFAYAVIYISAGLASILNATTTMFTAIVGYLWFKDKLTYMAAFGLIIGFTGVTILVWGKVSLDVVSGGLAVLAGLLASFSYSISINFIKRYMGNVDPLAIACGSQISAAIILLPLALLYIPDAMPSAISWLNIMALGIAGTGLAFIIYFPLIKSVGPAKASTVTYLIPVFGMFWGAVILNEVVTLRMVVACIIILLGAAMATGLIKFRKA